MKQTVLTVLLTLTVTFGGFYGAAQAGLWESVSGAFADTVESKLFAVEAQGKNIRGYIFDNPANPGHFCIVSASSNGGGLSCDWSK
jgi:hypothetical protein